MMTALMLVSLVPVQVSAGITPVFLDSTRTARSTEAEMLIFRLNEIKAMDRSKLSHAERKQLKTEVKEIKAKLKASGGGVYLSVGAIIIIILLLILLL